MLEFKMKRDEFKEKVKMKIVVIESQLKIEDLKKHIAYESIMQAWEMLKSRYELVASSTYLPEEVILTVDEMALYIGKSDEFKIIERRQGGVIVAYEIRFGDFTTMVEVHHMPVPEMPSAGGGILDFDTLTKMNRGGRRPRR